MSYTLRSLLLDVPEGKHFEPVCHPATGTTSGAAVCSFHSGAVTAGGGGAAAVAGSGGYPWWRPFYQWPRPEPLRAPSQPLRQFVHVSDGPTITMSGRALTHFVRPARRVRMPAPVVRIAPARHRRPRRRPIAYVEATLVPVPAPRVRSYRESEDDELLLILGLG